MAENKNKIVVYADWLNNFEDLTDEELGKLMRHFFKYVNDLNPVLEDRLLKIAWKPIETTLKRDLKKWENTIEEKSINGRIGNLKRYNTDLYELYVKKEITLEDAEQIAKHRKTSHSDKKPRIATNSLAKVAVNDNVNDNVNDSIINDHENFKNECLNSKIWQEQVAMTIKTHIDNIPLALKKFNEHLITTGENKMYLKDYKSHFMNWFRIIYEKEIKKK